MIIDVIKSTKGDNYFCLLAADNGQDGLLIDPVDADAALARVNTLGVTVTRVVNTHWHPDHTAGNAQVIAATGAKLLVPRGEENLIQGDHSAIGQGDSLTVGDQTLQVLATPGHTQGHISLYTPGHLFCGDTIFVGGAGNCRFGGDPHTLFQSFQGVLSTLPDQTLIYPGHDYSVRNLEFCLHLEPNNQAATDLLEHARHKKSNGGFVQTTLAQEKACSPFWHWDNEALQGHLSQNHPEAWAQGADLNLAARTFVAVRALRNSW